MQGQYWVFSNVMVCLPTSSVYFQTEADGKGQTFRSVGDTCAQLILYKTYPSSVFRELFFVRQLWLHHYSLCFHLCNLITYLLVSCKNPSLSKPFNLLMSFHIRCHIMPFPSSTVHHNCNKHVEINRKLFFSPNVYSFDTSIIYHSRDAKSISCLLMMRGSSCSCINTLLRRLERIRCLGLFLLTNIPMDRASTPLKCCRDTFWLNIMSIHTGLIALNDESKLFEH